MRPRDHPLVVLFLACAITWPAGAAGQPSASSHPAGSIVPKVRLIATGGTISNRRAARLTADELVQSIPTLDRYVRPETEQFSNTSSSALTLTQWRDLARRINALFQQDADLAGVVVSTGTDTLEETAYFLNLTVKVDKPVVVVGSMRDPNALGYDGTANLLSAFRVAAEPASRAKGVLVVMNDEIHAARDVAKTDTHRLDTFESRGHGPLGVVDVDRVVYSRTGLKRHTTAAEFDIVDIGELPRVDIVMVYQDAGGDVIKALVDLGAKGIVIAAAGAGALSGTQSEGLQYAFAKGVFVVVSSRTGSGRILGTVASPRLDVRPLSPYRIAAEDLGPVKARILLMLALATTRDSVAIRRMFTEY